MRYRRRFSRSRRSFRRSVSRFGRRRTGGRRRSRLSGIRVGYRM